MEEKNSPQHTHIDIYILLVVLALLGGLLYMFVSRKGTVTPTTQPTENEQQTDTTPTTPSSTSPVTTNPGPTATPEPKPIPHGKTDFFVSVGSNVKGPRMGKGTVDPYDPQNGTKQTVTIEANDTTPVQSVVLVVKTDHKTSAEIPLEQVAGTKNWRGSWTVDDTYLYTYQLTIKATSASGTSSVDVLLR
jgi:hypothetical protein